MKYIDVKKVWMDGRGFPPLHIGILDRVGLLILKLPQVKGRRTAPKETGMGKCKVVISYLDGRLTKSRYGFSQRVETAVRFCEESELDGVVEEFRRRGEIQEVKISR
jgi:hypothetical protein